MKRNDCKLKFFEGNPDMSNKQPDGLFVARAKGCRESDEEVRTFGEND